MVAPQQPPLAARLSAWVARQDFRRPALAEAVILAFERDCDGGRATWRWSRPEDGLLHPPNGTPIPVLVGWEELLAALGEAGLRIERREGQDVVAGRAT